MSRLGVRDGSSWRFSGWHTPEQSLPGEMPSKGSIIANAGLSSPGSIVASGNITVDAAYAATLPLEEGRRVLENRDVTGTINVRVSNLTIRNCRVRGYWVVPGINLGTASLTVTGTVIENCELFGQLNPNDSNQGSNAGIGAVGSSHTTTVRRCDIGGNCEPLKAESNSLYELNYIHPTLPPADPQHLDGIQGSGDSNVIVRWNVIVTPNQDHGNACVLFQGWSNRNVPISNVHILENYFRGGNYTIFMIGGKYTNESDPHYDPGDPIWWERLITNCSVIGNVIEADLKSGTSDTEWDTQYGIMRMHNREDPTMIVRDNFVNGSAVSI